jgi:aerobic-type carbon monoxide dehydrogenase small subunit (CoxS/CutS family)
VINTRTVALLLNGKEIELEAGGGDFLLESLRARGLFSVRGTCEIGVCGTCTVLVDGLAVSSCIALTALQQGRSIITSEGLIGSDGTLDEVQRQFVDKSAFQCSYCTPAMVLAVRAYLDETNEPTIEGASEALAGNLCRCGSYPQVLQAVEALIAARSPH